MSVTCKYGFVMAMLRIARKKGAVALNETCLKHGLVKLKSLGLTCDLVLLEHVVYRYHIGQQLVTTITKSKYRWWWW